MGVFGLYGVLGWVGKEELGGGGGELEDMR